MIKHDEPIFKIGDPVYYKGNHEYLYEAEIVCTVDEQIRNLFRKYTVRRYGVRHGTNLKLMYGWELIPREDTK